MKVKLDADGTPDLDPVDDFSSCRSFDTHLKEIRESGYCSFDDYFSFIRDCKEAIDIYDSLGDGDLRMLPPVFVDPINCENIFLFKEENNGNTYKIGDMYK